MTKKYRITCFVCFILLLGIVSSGCSKKDEETANNNDQINSEMESEYDTASDAEEPTKEPTKEPDNESVKEPTKDPVNEQVQEKDSETQTSVPWKLFSKSSVKTSVYYAGFLNEAMGVTVGYDGAISYTEDGGKNWSQGSMESSCRFGLDYYDEAFIISSGNKGENLVSKDKGNTWSQLGNFPLKSTSYYNKFLSILDTQNIYIGSAITLGVSKDGGLTWNELKLPEGCVDIAGMFFMTPEIGYLISVDGILYKTNDSCQTWTSQKIDLIEDKLANPKMPSAAINFQDEDHGLIVYEKKSFTLNCLKTEDGGNTWESIEMPKVFNCAPYLSRDGKYLTISSLRQEISLYKLED